MQDDILTRQPAPAKDYNKLFVHEHITQTT